MTSVKLTGFGAAVTSTDRKRVGAGLMIVRAGMLMLGTAVMAGCINVAAPTEPIVIELNINIQADVVYRLAEDAANTVEEYSDIF